jgi:hypothetical protein
MSNTALREVEVRNSHVGHRRGLVLLVIALIAATLGAWLVLDGRTTEKPPGTGASAVQIDPTYLLERDAIGMSFWGYETVLPGDLVVEQITDVTAVKGSAETYWVWAVLPPESAAACPRGAGSRGWGSCDDGWRGRIQRLALVPATAAALDGGNRDLDGFLLAALDGTEQSRANPDTLVTIGGVRVAQRDGGWDLAEYAWYRDGALFVYHGSHDWGDPLLAMWFAHPELVAIVE